MQKQTPYNETLKMQINRQKFTEQVLDQAFLKRNRMSILPVLTRTYFISPQKLDS